MSASTAHLRPFSSRHLGEQRFFTLGPLQPNYGSYFGIASANINDLPIPQLYAGYIHTRLDQFVNPIVLVGNSGGARNPFAPSPAAELLRNLDGYRQLGVDYVLTPSGQQLGQSPTGFQIAAKTPSTWIYHLSGAQSYFTAAGCRVHSTNRQNATAICTAPATLIRRETDLSGWSATVDGRSAPIGRADGLFQTVRLAAGAHRVQFSYEPPDILWAELAFLAGLLALLATAASARRARHTTSPA